MGGGIVGFVFDVVPAAILTMLKVSINAVVLVFCGSGRDKPFGGKEGIEEMLALVAGAELAIKIIYKPSLLPKRHIDIRDIGKGGKVGNGNT